MAAAHADEAVPIIPPELVAKYVATRIWKKISGGKPFSFVIAGSYAASWASHAHDPAHPRMAYNDVDVFIQCRDVPENHDGHIVSASDEKHVFPEPWKDIKANVVEMKRLTFENMIDHFDINNVGAGFLVEPEFEEIYGQKVGIPEIKDWYLSPCFQEFLVHRTLKMSRCWYRNPAAAVVRLLKKASQLNLPYELPSEESLRRHVHNRNFGVKNYNKMLSLQSSHRMEIDSRFDIKRWWWGNKKRVMWRLVHKRNTAAPNAALDEEDAITAGAYGDRGAHTTVSLEIIAAMRRLFMTHNTK